jgi:hypothetical protein
VVKRKGLDYTEYGLVDARAAKRQRLAPDAPDAAPCPVNLAMVEEYESFVKTFKRTFHHCTDAKGVLALGASLSLSLSLPPPAPLSVRVCGFVLHMHAHACVRGFSPPPIKH